MDREPKNRAAYNISMARDLSPKFKRSRREGIDLHPDLDKAGTAKSPLTRKNYFPGVHGPKARRSKVSNYGRQLREKQKAKRIYGILEKQFRNYYGKSIRQTGDTGEVMLSMLERRLDNVVYRLGLTKTRPAARQMVSHGLVLVNGKKVNIPSYQINIGDEISLKEKINEKSALGLVIKSIDRRLPGWLTINGFKGKVVAAPDLAISKEMVDMRPIIEFYSR